MVDRGRRSPPPEPLKPRPRCPTHMADHATEFDRWVRVGPKVERNLVIEAEGLHLVRYKVAAGHSVGLHSHRGAQITVILSGTGVHRFVLEVERRRRTRRVTTELSVGPGDCYYIPAGTPHSFESDPRRPVVLIDIMVRPRAHAPAASEPARPRAKKR
jgi:mannose-6-phosphate isomerase-like protein (cupin superfamily)